MTFLDDLGLKPDMTEAELEAAQLKLAIELANGSEARMGELTELDRHMLESLFPQETEILGEPAPGEAT